MDRRQFERTLTERYGIPADRPFAKDQTIAVFRHAENRRWFAVVMTIPTAKMIAGGEGTVDVVNLKCAPEMLDTLWQENGIYPAYHMSTGHWITALLDGRVSDETLSCLADVSFNLTSKKQRKQ